MKIAITPNSFLNQGMAHRLLSELGVGPILEDKGMIRCEMTQAQLDLFRLKGASHRVDVIPEPENDPAAETVQAPVVDSAPSITIEDSVGRKQKVVVKPA